jgi:iron complex transport system ATP-binding protein
MHIEDIHVHIDGHHILKDIGFTLAEAKLTVLVGPNGAGKSTLLRAMAALLPLSSGRIGLSGADIFAMMPQERARHIAYLPQERAIAWDMKAIEIAAMGGLYENPDLARHKAFEQLRLLGLQEFAERGVLSLSGGQRARVLLARVLASNAGIYLLDEPLVALDPAWQRQVLMTLKARAASGVSVCLSLHDLHLAAQFADELIILKQGEIVGQGDPLAHLTPQCLAEVFNLKGTLLTEKGQVRLRLDPEPLNLLA